MPEQTTLVTKVSKTGMPKVCLQCGKTMILVDYISRPKGSLHPVSVFQCVCGTRTHTMHKGRKRGT